MDVGKAGVSGSWDDASVRAPECNPGSAASEASFLGSTKNSCPRGTPGPHGDGLQNERRGAPEAGTRTGIGGSRAFVGCEHMQGGLTEEASRPRDDDDARDAQELTPVCCRGQHEREPAAAGLDRQAPDAAASPGCGAEASWGGGRDGVKGGMWRLENSSGVGGIGCTEHQDGSGAEWVRHSAGLAASSLPVVGVGSGVGSVHPLEGGGEASVDSSVAQTKEMETNSSAIAASEAQTDATKTPSVPVACHPDDEGLDDDGNPLPTPLQAKFLPLVESPYFLNTILLAIAVNCLQLATWDPLKSKTDVYKILDIILFVVFSCEFVLKLLALGWCGYWRDAWNKLDGTIVLVGYLAYIPGVGEFPAIRVLRIIRPMRVMGKLEGMKAIFVTLAAAAKPLFDTLLLCCLIFFMFGIVGITLFAGTTRHRCYDYDNATNTYTGQSTEGHVGHATDLATFTCGGFYTCLSGQECLISPDAPEYDIISFDNFLIGFLTIFVALTLEGWVDVMYAVQDGYGFWASTVYFHLLILFGSLFTLNLALAVISDAYDNQEDEDPLATAITDGRELYRELKEEAGERNDLLPFFLSSYQVKRLVDKAADEHEEDSDEYKAAIKDALLKLDPPIEQGKKESVKLRGMGGKRKMAKRLDDVVGKLEEAKEYYQGKFEEEEVEEGETEDQLQERYGKERREMPGWRQSLHMIAVSNSFDKLIMGFIILNTVVLACENAKTVTKDGIEQGAEMSDSFKDVLSIFNYIFTAVFALEAVIKIVGLGVQEYIKYRFNIFDFTIVIISFVELGLAGNSSFGALRTFRLARIFKLAKNWASLRNLLITIAETLPAISYLSLLLLLFMFIASVGGMMFFGGRLRPIIVDPDGDDNGKATTLEEVPRSNFDNFGIAMLTVFQMLTGENWNSVLYNGIEVSTFPEKWVIVVPYFLVVQVVGGFVILNLFLAILLANFGAEDDEGAPTFPSLEDAKLALEEIFISSNKVAKVEPAKSESADAEAPDAASAVEESVVVTPEPPKKADDCADSESNNQGAEAKDDEAGTSPREMEGQDMLSPAERIAKKKEQQEFEKRNPGKVLEASDMTLKGTSCCFFPHDDPLRRRLAVMVGYVPEEYRERINPVTDEIIKPPRFQSQTLFSNFIFMCILISSIALAVDSNPSGDEKCPDANDVLVVLDIMFTVLFSVELIIKAIVYGFIWTEEAYLKDAWNMIDCFIVITSILSLFSFANGMKFLKVLRTFRALRPLRMINRAPGLKVVVDAIIFCLPAFIRITLVTSLVYLVFAIMGTQLWAGKFWYCTDSGDQFDYADVENVSQCTGTASDGRPRWRNAPLNFDNVGTAYLTLFEVATLELWLDVMYSAMDVPDKIGEQPKRFQSWGWAVYFVVFVIIGSFLFLNLFVGAVVDNFNRIKQDLDRKGAVMTEDQEKFVQSLKTMFNKKPIAKPFAPEKEGCWGKLRYNLFKMIRYDYSTGKEVKKDSTPIFDSVIMILISANILVMAANVWVQPPFPTKVGSQAAIDAQDTSWNSGLEMANSVFNFIFLTEACTKLIALGSKQYFKSGMNTFDFVIVCISLLGFVVDLVLGSDVDPSLISLISVIKAGRVIRIFRLAMRIKGIRRLLETLLYTLPSLGNVAALLCIILFIYSVLGMAFFCGQEFDKYPYYLYNEHANFKYFHMGFFTLFRMATGESWNGIMHDSMENIGTAAQWYYTSYMIFGAFLLFQLIVAVVLEQFGAAAAEEADDNPITPDHIDDFATVWREYDPMSTNLIDFGTVPLLIRNLPLWHTPLFMPMIDEDPRITEILELELPIPDSLIMQLMDLARVKAHDGKAHYVETFFSLVKHTYKVDKLSEELQEEMADILMQGYPSLEVVPLDKKADGGQHVAAMKIQTAMRAKLGRRKVIQRRALRTASEDLGREALDAKAKGLQPKGLPTLDVAATPKEGSETQAAANGQADVVTSSNPVPVVAAAGKVGKVLPPVQTTPRKEGLPD